MAGEPDNSCNYAATVDLDDRKRFRLNVSALAESGCTKAPLKLSCTSSEGQATVSAEVEFMIVPCNDTARHSTAPPGHRTARHQGSGAVRDSVCPLSVTVWCVSAFTAILI